MFAAVMRSLSGRNQFFTRPRSRVVRPACDQNVRRFAPRKSSNHFVGIHRGIDFDGDAMRRAILVEQLLQLCGVVAPGNPDF